MKNYLLLFCIISICLLQSCDQKTKKNDKLMDKKNIIVENIKALKSISTTDSLEIRVKQLDEQFQVSFSDSLIGEFRKELGYLFYMKSDYLNAEQYFIRSEKSFRKANMELQATQMLGNRAIIKDLAGDYRGAIAIYLEVASYFKEQQDSASWASALGNIGVVYEEMGMGNKAIYYDKLGLAINLAMGDTLKAASKYNNIGVAYAELKQKSDSSAFFYTKAYEIYTNKGPTLYGAIVGNNLAMQHLKMKDFSVAEKYLQKSIAVFDSLGNKKEKGVSLQYLGELRKAQGNNLKAMVNYERAMVIFKKRKDRKDLFETANSLSDVYIALGKYAKAAILMQKNNALKDSLMSSDNKRIIAEMEAKYQLKEKNNSIKRLKLIESLNNKKHKIQWIIIILLTLLFILLIVIYIFRIQKNKLKEKEHFLEVQNYIIRNNELQIIVNKKNKIIVEKLKQFDISEREADVLKLISNGYKNLEIADKLFLSQNTIKTHIKNIYLKLDVRNRVEALKKIETA